jgi:hypothetical protein
VHTADGFTINSTRARCNLRNLKPSCIPWPSQSTERGAGKKTHQSSPEIQSWIDNVIVPILIQKLLQELEQQKAA